MMSRMVVTRLTSCIVPLLVQIPTNILLIGIALLFVLIAGIAMAVILRLRAQLNNTRAELSAQIQGKFDMITNFNREVRTPLNAVIGMSEQLAHTSLDKDQRELLHSIESAANMLLRIMNNAQEIHRFENGEVRLKALPFEVYTVFSKVMEEERKGAFEKGLYLEAKYEGDHHLRIIGDESRLDQIVRHLVENAIRYTQSGGIIVRMQVGMGEDNKAGVQFSVEDTGMGIQENLLPHLFAYYSFARPPQLTAISGPGLGLAIIQHILQLHGTELTVESEPGRGSRFAFQVMYPVASSQTIVITARELEEMTGQFMEGRNVLIADDQEMNLLLLSRILSRWKCNFDKAYDGLEAYELFCHHEYDLVLLDVQMPGMNGKEVVRKIREDSDAMKAKIPVLAITSDITMTDNGRYSELGFNDCLLKPFRERDIYNTIIRHLPPAGVKVM